MWNNNTNQDLYVLDKEGFKQFMPTDNLESIEEFWK